MVSNPLSPGNTIELRVREIAQLFHTLDPFPFRERDLGAEVEDYIVGWAGELRSKGPFRIIVHLPSTEATTKRANELEAALQHFFEYRAQVLEREFKELMRVGRLSMLVGLGVFIVCLTASHLAARYLVNSSTHHSTTGSSRACSFLVGWPIGGRSRSFCMIGGPSSGVAGFIAVWPPLASISKPMKQRAPEGWPTSLSAGQKPGGARDIGIS